ncbi:hypothetical protein FOM00_21020 [Pseudomonas sp. ST1]|uniref:hypothetical protein n=1 Tax=Pseudomonas sp. ST1 TaxID=2596897 RepID=UPI00117C9242|nr:hypothetical protein [Pseudomonas sp. ST1]TSC35154.1 hypothetical protein FOM00_21020 [Pseudomonas sp. ST1]
MKLAESPEAIDDELECDYISTCAMAFSYRQMAQDSGGFTPYERLEGQYSEVRLDTGGFGQYVKPEPIRRVVSAYRFAYKQLFHAFSDSQWAGAIRKQFF